MGVSEPGTAPPASSARVYLEKDMTQAQLLPFAAGEVSVMTAAAPSRGRPNEDACAVLPYGEALVLVVSDGAGGTRHAGEAARITVSALRKALDRGRAQALELRAAVLDGIEEANRRVLELGGGAAATLCAVAIADGAIRPYHVGDSTILLVGGRGKIKHRNVAHSPVGYAEEAGVLSEQEAMHHDERHVVSNVIGADDMRIEVGPKLVLAPRDTLLLASDGLSDNLFVEEVTRRLRSRDLAGVAAGLVADCRQRMLEPAAGQPSKEDDVTLVLFRPPRARRR